ncbi:MAG: TonB family protein [Prolixibacteraceae bacterium]|jgi:TonB family protein|nr:TonB family protein [Prolixibacteraceae bacterium]
MNNDRKFIGLLLMFLAFHLTGLSGSHVNQIEWADSGLIISVEGSGTMVQMWDSLSAKEAVLSDTVKSGTSNKLIGSPKLDPITVLRGIDVANPPLISLDGVTIDKNSLDHVPPDSLASVIVMNLSSPEGIVRKDGVVMFTTKAKARKGTDLSNPPLFFIDGKLIDIKIAKQIKSDQIASFTILKDEQAIDLYGEKGKYGVILIKSKINTGNNEEIPFAKDGERPPGRENGVFMVVDEMPEFPGGKSALDDFLLSEIRYPTDAQKEKIQGKVLVSFVVATDGKVEHAKIAYGVFPSLNREVLRVINRMPYWKPGKFHGQVVRVAYTLPIMFLLQ